MNTPKRRLHDLKSTAYQLGISTSHLETLVGRGDIECIRLGARRMFDVEEILVSLKRQAKQPEPLNQ